MWIPLQPDGVTLRREPFVTFGLLGFLVLCQVGLSLFPKTRLKQPLQAMVSYGSNHNYLKASPEIEAIIKANRHTINVFKQPQGNRELTTKQQKRFNSLKTNFASAWHKHPLYHLSFRPPLRISAKALTYVFVSGSVLLLVWNLFMLYMSAPLVEDRWGRVYFGAFLFACALVGAIGHGLHHSAKSLALAGAGSLVAGVLGAYAVIFDDQRITIRQLISRMDQEYKVPAWSIFLVWLVGCGILMIAIGGGMRLVSASWPSLIYPFVFGLVVAGVIRVLKLEKTMYKSPFDRLEKDQQYLVRIDRELRVGSPKKALEIMWEASRAFPDRLDFLQPCWDQAIRTGVLKDIDAIGQSLLKHYFHVGDLDAAWFILEEIHKQNIAFHIAYEQQLVWAEAFFMAGQGGKAAELLQRHAHPIPRQADLRDQILQLATDSDVRKAYVLITRWLNDDQISSDDKEVLLNIKAQIEQEIDDLNAEAEEAIAIVDDRPAHLPEEDPFANSLISKLKVIAIQPIALHREAIRIRMPSGAKKSLPFERIRAMAAGSLHLGGDTYWLIDFHLEDPFEPNPKHHVLRLSSHRLDPSDPLGEKLAKGEAAFLKLGRWIAQDSMRLLPEYDLFQTESLVSYPSVAAFEKDVYGTTSGDPDPV